MQQQLTTRQKEFYDWIAEFIRSHGYAPSIRDIGDHFGITINGVACNLRIIERKGWIRTTPRTARSIVLLNGVPGPGVE